MKKSDLKALIKPIVKECIQETLIEEGLLSSIVSEVTKGMRSELVLESPHTLSEPTPPPAPDNRKHKQKLKEQRQKLMDSIGLDAYNGVDLFEGTAPMTREETKGTPAGAVDLGNSSDAGVDISSLVGGASHVWNAMK